MGIHVGDSCENPRHLHPHSYCIDSVLDLENKGKKLSKVPAHTQE